MENKRMPPINPSIMVNDPKEMKRKKREIVKFSKSRLIGDRAQSTSRDFSLDKFENKKKIETKDQLTIKPKTLSSRKDFSDISRVRRPMSPNSDRSNRISSDHLEKALRIYH